MIDRSAIKPVLLATAALLSTPVFAADEPSSIVVTGQRQAYRGDVPVKELPQTIQLIDAKLMDVVNLTKMDSITDIASGIVRQNNFGGLWDSFAIRGFAGDENFPTGVLVNGFNGGRGYGGARDASNVETIEVLKGPNGAVFGRGEPGGTINIITKKAKLGQTFGKIGAQAGSFDTYRGEGDLNIAISDKLAIRANGAIEDAGSFRNTVKSSKEVVNPSILWQPTDKTSLSYELEYVSLRTPFDRGIVAINGKLGAVSRNTFLGEPGDGPTRVNVLGHQAQLQQKLGGDWVVIAGFGLRETSMIGFSEDAELAPGRQTFYSTGTMLARQRRYRDFRTRNITGRAEISGRITTGPILHHVLLGADMDEFDINLLQTRYRPVAYTAGSPVTAASNAINVFAPVYGLMPTPTSTVFNSLEKQKSWGIYFQDQMDIGEKVKIRFGGRFDHFNQQIGARVGNFAPTTNSVKERFSPTVGLLYDVNPRVGLYAAWGNGFRPNSGTDANNNPFAPETSKSYEVGARYTSKVISASLAVFTMTKQNILTSDPINAGFSIAGGSARSTGVEAGVDGHLPGMVELHATYAYTDAHWTSSSLDPNFSQTIQPGAKLINIPAHTANLLVTKGFDLGEKGKVTVGAGVNYVSSRLGETATTFFLPAYTLTRALLTYEPTKRIRLGVDVTNLFDITWYASSYSTLWVAPGAPRTITGRISYAF
ncbi:TonB-dependent siderophore receptor [Novosphingobium humi]|uniref:TonB-dependent receptor n=1 Tax=Novosphingobium humi TaxID=2282397 RepID=A0ABY7TZ58_9SPHN|nr:TonB-dependent receptor [Novosphingobium humi]WCT78574.1 TonB-dependent receptor [Novosphingobium humi]WJS97872.1 TonB-dependent receptor [Novosphingobium humi]